MEEEKEALEVALQAGHILLENGAEIFRVEETIDRISKQYGAREASAFVLSNGIFLTGSDRENRVYAKVRHIPVQGTHLNRVIAVNRLSREIEAGKFTIEEAREQLGKIQEMPEKSRRMQVLASGMGSGAFCFLFGGSLVDAGLAFLTGCILYLYILFVSGPHFSKIISNISGGALVTMMCILFYTAVPGSHLNFMIIGAIMPLIPGVAFTNGIRDIADGDYISGSVRLLDAILGFLCIATGVGLVISAYHTMMGGILL